ncbi:CusA/CzcA family heavy metal efflux RND transporter [Flammeovirga yaeyamensis]|uniref:CusA/CzcA family heavy metal efflux RND transporter n=1 Tax=Flammeovirga yaeyamensis TaxID=367791 RepID=A0AAX1N407_9BACT|nr:CusA/CzcA family heavy metal efflux RND transporter [Flammeovirga yaeyamensis]NMF34597.1 CusA/CzcA family heavy metal efflux RND transporter [Flammeovirga yaeyamensis]QWG00573.1 CusA/CzcA family heavy metal efflux RND transporter [Flammeovirga yaeyamensis]
MINQIISFSIKNKLLIGVMMIFWIIAGIWSITKVPVDAVPDITNNQVQIITQAPSLGTEEVEQFITYPIELSMANLPDVIEIRSVSRSGLSLVTVVFDDDAGTYLPRQLVAEKLPEVREKIPQGFGEPFIGPISTGLGEIYQYTLEVAPEFKDKYSLSDLRTIQDWIIRRQMAMVPGVVEVNAFGGYIKEYEVSIRPDQLNAMGISMDEIFTALEKNNQNSGAAYIVKNHKANYIRGEGLARSIEDIENIVVANQGGLPILIKDVGKVQYGHAVRYGALTKEGEGEAVGGMILMLKGANSRKVIHAVQDRVDLIQKSLPEGVQIKEFLARNKLIDKTTSTVYQNLIEGALIVIFVLVLLLGNWRGGFVVASTIPLSLLFAFILMHQFDVWANLMSLGAMDFGIIVDGAVIIVEATIFLMYSKLRSSGLLSSDQKDEVTYKASSKMMNSAFFGQLIILIVFAPILTLEGVEGKMFKPMALAFMFAMLGVMILCLTYVPMMSSLFIKVKENNSDGWGTKFIKYLENLYVPLLSKALSNVKWVIGSSLVLLCITLGIFSSLGGEFMTQLDEGDIAYHVILKPGSSLEESIAATTQVEQIMKENFPEIEQVMSRIGVAEVPTDPMPFDVADCLVILKPKSEWTSAETKEELIQKIKEKVSQVPGINYEFTQPIEMRFNELISGVREDIAIKLFGEDLNILADKANEISKLIAGVEGIGDMRVEATDGLPQYSIKYNRKKIAQYGMNIQQLNDLIQTAFAGKSAGLIFEGEKRFDLVVRFEKDQRSSIEQLKELFVTLPNGKQIPLYILAEIKNELGPMQISRDNTQRRTYVGINVRGRDIQSVVNDVQQILDEQLDLPPGYFIRYGGQFENLERANRRLKIVVPLALASIFILLMIALKSWKQALMINVAIPFACIGGVVGLWGRGLPFSISAGVGFVVLFGVAVLNGLVLIEGWNELKSNENLPLKDRITEGAKRRIRPILLTALTDILGFLPMAISSSAGAEVQRPLATVVIGGMITSTLLTLFVLPVLYQMMEKKESIKVAPSVLTMLTLFIGIPSLFNVVNAQDRLIKSQDEAVEIGMIQNGYIINAQKGVEWMEVEKKRAFDIDKLQLDANYGQYNSYHNDLGFEVTQNFNFPTVYGKQKGLAKEKVSAAEYRLELTKSEMKREIKKAWETLTYLKEKEELMNYQDSIFKEFQRAAQVRYETQATNYLALASAETQVMKIENDLYLLSSDILIEENKLRVLLQDTIGFTFQTNAQKKRSIEEFLSTDQLMHHPKLNQIKQEIQISEAEKKVASAKMLPNIKLGYFNNSMTGSILENGAAASSSTRFQGVKVGVGIPLFFGSEKAVINQAKLKAQMSQVAADQYSIELKGEYYRLHQQKQQLEGSLRHYEEKALPQAERIIEFAQKSYHLGAINYVEFFQNINQSLGIKYNYLTTVNNYNQVIIQLEYLMNK